LNEIKSSLSTVESSVWFGPGVGTPRFMTLLFNNEPIYKYVE